MYYTPVFFKCIIFFRIFYTFVAFTILSIKILALFVNLTLAQMPCFRGISATQKIFLYFSDFTIYFSVSVQFHRDRPRFLHRGIYNVSDLRPRARVVRLQVCPCVVDTASIHGHCPSFPAFYVLSVFSQPAARRCLHICCIRANTTITTFERTFRFWEEIQI